MREDWLKIVAEGEDAELSPSTEHAIRTARHLVGTPTTEGGFQIELHAGGADVEIDIAPGGEVTAVNWMKV